MLPPMRRTTLLRRGFLLLLLLPLLIPTAIAARRDPAPPHHSTATWQAGRVLVKLADPGFLRLSGDQHVLATGALGAKLQALDAGQGRALGDGLFAVDIAANADVPAAARELAALPGVAYAEPDYLLTADLIPNDPLYRRQWALPAIDAPAAWDLTTGSGSIIVAMLDTGVSPHPDLRSRLISGFNALANNASSADDNGHGTFTAGVVAASGNNGLGVAGVAWGVRIMPVKVLNNDGSGAVSDFVEGIRFAVDNGARVINISAGVDEPMAAMHDAIRYASDNNVLVVASAGNTPDGGPRYPAGYDETLAVSATGEGDTSAPFSSYGPYVDISAPGADILSTSWSNGAYDYTSGSGTSAAAPFVTGAAALALSLQPSLTATELRQRLIDSAVDLGDPGPDSHFGAGRLDLLRLLRPLAPPTPTAPPTNTPTITPTRRPTNTPAPPTATSIAPPTSTNAPEATATDTAVPTATEQPTATATTPPAQAQLSAQPGSAGPGDSLMLTGANFGSNELIGLRMTASDGRNHELGSASADGAGDFAINTTLPADLAPGGATIYAQGARTNLIAQTTINVSAAPTSTPQPTAPPIALSVQPDSAVPGGGITLRGANFGSNELIGLRMTASDGRNHELGSASADGAGDFSLNTTLPNDLAPGGAAIYAQGARSGLTAQAAINIGAAQPTNTPVPQPTATAAPPPSGPLPTPGAPLADPAVAFAPITSDKTPFDAVFFRQVGHTLGPPFLAYWQQMGGLPIFGYPISEPFTEVAADNKPYIVQYFERNRFEYHPELAATGNVVLLGRLGREMTRGREFPPAQPSSEPGAVFFAPTGHNLSKDFLLYWQAHGGLALFGYPISEPLSETAADGKQYLVQYFERNRFELHPELASTGNTVLLGRLGSDYAKAKGWMK